MLEEEEIQKAAVDYADQLKNSDFLGIYEIAIEAFIAGYKLADELHREENKHAAWDRDLNT